MYKTIKKGCVFCFFLTHFVAILQMDYEHTTFNKLKTSRTHTIATWHTMNDTIAGIMNFTVTIAHMNTIHTKPPSQKYTNN